MASILKRFKGLLPLLVLAAISLRVITGAAEVQVNFTSIIFEKYKSVGSEVDKESILNGVVASNPTDASSIPDNLKTFATYKKYLTPEGAFQIPNRPSLIPLGDIDIGGTLINPFSRKVIYKPTSHSPPAVVSAHLRTHTTSTVESVNLENYIGEIAINNSTGGIGRL